MATPNSHNEWCSPPDLFKVLNDEFSFDLDAAASDDNHLCSRYITQQMDALVTPWEGKSVYCNPPYSMLPEFIQRGYEQHIAQKNTVVMLIPAYSDTKYWADFVMKAHEVRFLKGRLRFWENGAVGKDTARFSSALVVWKWIKGNHFGKGPQQWVWDWRA